MAQEDFEIGRVMHAWFTTPCLLTVDSVLLAIDSLATTEIVVKLGQEEFTIVRFKAVAYHISAPSLSSTHPLWPIQRRVVVLLADGCHDVCENPP